MKEFLCRGKMSRDKIEDHISGRNLSSFAGGGGGKVFFLLLLVNEKSSSFFYSAKRGRGRNCGKSGFYGREKKKAEEKVFLEEISLSAELFVLTVAKLEFVREGSVKG